MHGKGRYVDANGGQHDGVWMDGVCPEVDFTHVPECGNFRYCFSVREASRSSKGSYSGGLADGMCGRIPSKPD